MLPVLFIPSIGLAAVTTFGLAWYFVCSPARRSEPPAEIFEISVERYIPMLRLLDDSDFRFLRAQPGFTTEMAARVRAQRYRIFLAYLRNLREDFARIAAALKFLMAHSPHDRPDLASVLLRAQLVFAWGFATAYLRAYVWRFGYGSVNAGELLRVFDGICFELSSLSPNPTPA